MENNENYIEFPNDLLERWEFSALPQKTKTAGGYNMCGSTNLSNSIIFHYKEKPSWFKRTMCKFLIGWVWIDSEKMDF